LAQVAWLKPVPPPLLRRARLSTAMALASLGNPSLQEPSADDLEHLAHDRHLCDKIMKKRQQELERRAKLHDPRRRKCGVEHAALDVQVAAKAAIAERGVVEEALYAETGSLHQQVQNCVEEAKKVATRERQKAVVEYSRKYLGKEQRREWDLSKPDALRNDDPFGAGSSVLTFQGEDPGYAERCQENKRIMRERLQEQIAIKTEQAEMTRQAEEKDDQAMLTANEVRAICEQAAEDERREEKVEEASYNAQLAEAMRRKRLANAEGEAEVTQKHIEKEATTPRMTEIHDYKINASGRIEKDTYKRPTSLDVRKCLDENARLVLQSKVKKLMEKEEEDNHARHTAQATSILGVIETEKKRKGTEKLMQMVEENKALAEAKLASDLDSRQKYRSFEDDA